MEESIQEGGGYMSLDVQIGGKACQYKFVQGGAYTLRKKAI